MKCLPDELLQAYIDGQLSRSDAADPERHLELCPACRERLAHLRSASRIVKEKLSELAPTHIPAAPLLETEKLGRSASLSPYWRRLLASSIRVPAAILAMAGLFVLGVALGTVLKGPAGAGEDRWSERQLGAARASLGGTDSVQVIPGGLDLEDYRPIDRPTVFIIKE